MESIWHKTITLPKRKSLNGPIRTEAAVIGGGLAGVLTARMLEQKGVQTILLEAESIGSGQTGNTTAKISMQHGLLYHRLIQDFGEDAAASYAKANLQALRLYRQLIQKYHIPCEFIECPSYLYSTEPNTLFLMSEANDAAYLGIPASYTHETSLPFPITGALRFEHQAMFHPLQFLSSMSAGLTVYENTPVLHVDGSEILTESGSVHADHVIFATHYPITKLAGCYFTRMYQERSYVLALENAPLLDGMYLGIDEDGLSFRNSGPYLLAGGVSHRTGHNAAGGQYNVLRNRIKKIFPDAREVAHWSAQDCMTADGIPYIGRFSRHYPNWYTATGFGKWGMTNSMIAACIISDLITDRPNEFADLYSPLRSLSLSSSSFFMEHGKETVINFSKRFFEKPEKSVDSLENGQGAIVSINGTKAGAYKDEHGEVFTVPAKCPHLGCQLSFNADEKTWECPCHGTRLDYRGNIIDSPAKKSSP